MKGKIKSLKWIISAAALTVPGLAMAQLSVGIPTTANTGISNQNILQTLSNVLKWMLAAVGILGVLAFVVAGIMYLTAAGDEDRIKTAKNAMTYAVVGLVVALVGLIIVTTASQIFGSNPTGPTTGQ
jgi:cytochrome bd-type quinol oxidase subunit 2